MSNIVWEPQLILLKKVLTFSMFSIQIITIIVVKQVEKRVKLGSYKLPSDQVQSWGSFESVAV